MSRRTERVNHTMMRELGALIAGQLNDPRIPTVMSVTDVQCDAELEEAVVSVSVFGAPGEQAEALAALEAASGYLRRELAGRMRLRQIPRLRFKLDTTIQKAQEMLSYINAVATEDRRRGRERTA